MALMPPVRIRNVTREYKLAAAIFTPALLELEEQGPYSRKPKAHEEVTTPQGQGGEQRGMLQRPEAG